jgi:lysophospholipase L1-like esterase
MPSRSSKGRAHSSLGRRYALACTSLALTLTVLELCLRMYMPVRNVGPSFTTHDEVYGKALKKSYRCERSSPEFTMRFSTNSLGFRGAEPQHFPSGGVLFLGDSFTMGYGVSDGREFPALVGEALARRYGADGVPVVNAGIGDSGNGRWLHFLTRDAARFAPRAVVLQLCSNDVMDNVREGAFRLDPSGSLVPSKTQGQASWRRRAQQAVESVPGLTHLHLLGLLRQGRARARPAGLPAPAGTPEPSAAEALTLRLLDEALTLAAERQWPAVVLAADLDARFSRLVEQELARRGQPLVRVPAKEERPDLYYGVDGHWNERGHALAARLVMAELVRRGLLPEQPDKTAMSR